MTSSTLSANARRRMGLVLGMLTPLVVIVAIFGSSDSLGATSASPAPSAKDFAAEFMGVTNAYAREHGSPTRITHADCVQGRKGRYMCSYLAVRRGARQCHLIQATWTPRAASSFRVTLSGRTARCGTLREAMDSLE
jgi:hypothetical protein